MLPQSEAALADAIRAANGPLSISGGGTRGVAQDGMPLSVRSMSGISLYEPGALTLVAQSGTPIAEIEAALAAEKQRLAFEPMDARALMGTTGSPTLGGVIAANVSGPRRIQGGAARDYALGVRFVDGAGNIVKNGGRVMKNVTGYDLVKLMSGAFGTLGVLTEVAIKVLPTPETQGTLILHGLCDEAAVAAMSQAMGSPFEVTGAAHGAGLLGDTPVTALRVEGFEASVAYRLEQLKKLLAATGAELEIAGPEASASVWAAVRDATVLAQAEGDVWRVSCKPSDAPRLAASSGAEQCFFDWGGGLIWLLMPAGTNLRTQLGAYDGHATRVRGTSGLIPRFQPEAPGVARLSAGLRAKFDPNGILNTGLMGPVAVEA
ncbi:MAG: FAD-binding protein [Roseobacter sp.]